MKLAILVAAIIIGRQIEDPTYMSNHVGDITTIVVLFLLWELADLFRKTK